MDADDQDDLIAMYREVARDSPREALDERILSMAMAPAKRPTTTTGGYAVAATVLAAAIWGSFHSQQQDSSPLVPHTADGSGLIEGSTRAFLLRQTGAEGMGPGDSLFVRIESDLEDEG